jgi:hypothetical protein
MLTVISDLGMLIVFRADWRNGETVWIALAVLLHSAVLMGQSSGGRFIGLDFISDQ